MKKFTYIVVHIPPDKIVVGSKTNLTIEDWVTLQRGWRFLDYIPITTDNGFVYIPAKLFVFCWIEIKEGTNDEA